MRDSLRVAFANDYAISKVKAMVAKTRKQQKLSPAKLKKSALKISLLLKVLDIVLGRTAMPKKAGKLAAKASVNATNTQGRLAVKLKNYKICDAEQFENTLQHELHGKELHPDFHKQFSVLNEQLRSYHRLLNENVDKPIKVKVYWEKLDHLGNKFGKCLLWLCDQEGKLKFDKSLQGKYEQISPFIMVVEKEFHKITQLKNELEKEWRALGKKSKIPHARNYKKSYAAYSKSNLSFDEVMRAIYFKKHKDVGKESKVTANSLK